MNSAFPQAESVADVAKRIITARDAEVAHFAKLYPLLLAVIDEIMAEWDRTTDQLPWSLLKAGDRQNDLSGVVTRVIDCAMSTAVREERVSALVDAACRHGQARRCQGVEMDSVFLEYDKVRAATWKELQHLTSGRISFDAIFVIDGLLSVATRGTILGFHKAEMEANGLWEKHRQSLRDTVQS